MDMNQDLQSHDEIDLLRMLAESEEDVRMGRVAPMQSTFDDIRLAMVEAR